MMHSKSEYADVYLKYIPVQLRVSASDFVPGMLIPFPHEKQTLNYVTRSQEEL